MKTHRFDALSFLLGIATIVLGITTISGRLGTVLNDRPDSVIPMIVLGAGLVAIAVAAKRAIDRPNDATATDRQPT